MASANTDPSNTEVGFCHSLLNDRCSFVCYKCSHVTSQKCHTRGPLMDKLRIATLLLHPHATIIVHFFCRANDRKELTSVDRKAVNWC